MIQANELLQQVKAVWHVDENAVEEIEDGFLWWPGNHKVTARCSKSQLESDPDAWRLIATTEFIKGVDLGKKASFIALVSALSPTYAWVYTPPEVTKRYGLPDDGAISFHSSVYVRPETVSWLPAHFARLAIMQPIDAQRMADTTAKTLGGSAHYSGPRYARGSEHGDEILEVAEVIYSPAGKEPSKWAGSAEFGAIAERYGKNDMCFGMGDGHGLTLETPFGSDSALIGLQHDQTHPALGAGLLTTIQLPVSDTLDASTDTCMWLNFFAATMWTSAPMLGTWHPKERGEKRFLPAYGTFTPNALYADSLATNMALWSVGLARWTRQRVWPDVQDLTMIQVLNARLGIDPKTI
jgi:hypothetical protein